MEPVGAGDPLVLGRYRILGRLGAGGMGRVYLGRGSAGELVAVKMMHSRIADDPGFRGRFATEVELVRRIHSPGVARLVDADPDGPLPWLAMEHVPGPSLEAAVAVGPLDEPALGVLAHRLAVACADLHRSRIAHRDLKPSNVLLAVEGPKLIDFGIARAVDATSATRTGVVLGPPGYMSPEQALGADPGLASDLFSLAGVLVFAATGRGPFGEAANAVAMLRRIVDGEPDLTGLPGPMRESIKPCFAKDPDARPTAAELATELAGRGTGPWPPPVVLRLGTTPPTRAAPTVRAAKRAARRAVPRNGPLFTRREVLSGLGIGLGVGLVTLDLAVLVDSPALRLDSSPSGPSWRRRWSVGTAGDVGVLTAVTDAVYAATADRVHAIAPDGTLRWEAAVEQTADLAAAGTGQVCAGTADRLVALDPGTGARVWEYGGGPALVAVPASGDAVYTAVDDRVVALNARRGEVRWVGSAPGGPVRALSASAAGCVLVTGSEVVAFDARSGELSWRRALGADGSHLAVEDDIAAVLAGSDLVGVDIRTGAELWRADVGPAGTAATVPARLAAAAAGTVAVLGGDGRVHAFGLDDGSASWASPVVRGADLLVAVTDGDRVFASTVDGPTYVLDLGTGVARYDVIDPYRAHLLGARDGVAYYAGSGAVEAYHLEER